MRADACVRVSTCSSSLDSVQDGFTPLIMASQNGHWEVARMLLEAKADINMKNNVSKSSLFRLLVMAFVH